MTMTGKAACCIGLSFLMYSTVASGQRQQKGNDLIDDGLQGKVKSITVKEYAQTNDTAQKGNLLEHNIRYYDEQGYLTETKEFDASGELSLRQVFTYSKKRNKKEELLYDENGTLIEKTLTKLNSAGNPTQSIITDSRGNLQQKNTYDYDEKNRLIKQNGYNEKGKLSERNYYTYNEKEVLIQYISFSEYENRKILYKYDANKNPIEMMVYEPKTNVLLEKIVQKFDAQKNRVEANYWDEKNNLKSSIFCKYDEKGNQLEYTVLDSAKNIQELYVFVYQYDTHNNWVSQTVYKGIEKEAETRIERKIEYYE
ncbi:MAG: hypothetical protein FWH36_08105 [Lentimicrobiaceae bacterium]|nr:hypothetical protein [Lentimicrobiaceae bacterium]